eukprot:TRINITY_DN2170_c3_g1_i1.p1 TRINITY_DN2170_c3_g1~~TRINITY_DN2170_c3_g1_i1.p1  ORF type:complete len:571 (+),score=80.11 TRINITY_DN2170_c3_g1_i1:52-1764(+)
MNLLGRFSRSIRCASSSQILYGFNGKVVAFDTTKDSALKQETGFESGDRIRSYAGNRIGQVGVVVGLRNKALFVKFNDDDDLQAYHVGALGRSDFRFIDHVGLRGLDPELFKENDQYTNTQYLEKDVRLASKMPASLDDAALQHLTREQSCGVRCQRCSEQRDFEEIKQAVESLGEMHRATQRIIRLLSLQSDKHQKLTSKEAISRAIDQALEENRGSTYRMSAAEALSKIIEARASDFDHTQTIEVATQRYEVPKGILREITTLSELKTDPWVTSLKSIPDGATTCQRISDVSGNIQLPERRIYAALANCSDDSASIQSIAGASDLHVDEPERDYYLTALQLSDGASTRPYTTLASIKTALGVDSSGRVNEHKFIADLIKRQSILNSQVSVRFTDGSTGTIPKAALKQTAGQEVTIIDEPWCREVVETHLSLPKNSADDFYGKSGRVQGRGRQEPINSDSIGTRLLNILSRFKGRHTEQFIPFADVFVPEGKYKYLHKACAVELYANADEQPAMYDAGGLPQYKANAWLQPLNLTNQYPLDQFAPATHTGHSFFRKTVNFTLETPTPEI